MKHAIGPLEREIQQTRPFRSPAEEGVVALVRTADLLRRFLTRLVEPHGITLQQYNVLRILRGAGEPGLPTLEIGARMIEQAPGITRLLDRLEAKGLVQRARCPHDRRQILCGITPAGLDILALLEEPMLTGASSFLSPLNPTDLESLLRALEALRASNLIAKEHTR